MPDIVDEAPKEKRTAKKGGKTIVVKIVLGPQQLLMAGDSNPIGKRTTLTTDIVNMVDVDRFMDGIRSTRDNLKNQIVNMDNQIESLEKLGANECGPLLASLLTEARNLAKDDKAWTKFQRKLFKQVGSGKGKNQQTTNVIQGTLNQWQKYKQLTVQRENVGKNLESSEEYLDILGNALGSTDGTPSK